MSLKSNIVNRYFHQVLTVLIASSAVLTAVDNVRANQHHQNKSDRSPQTLANSTGNLARPIVTASNFAVLPSTLELVKQHEGFSSSAYIDTSGLPVIGYGQTRINGVTVTMGQYITQAQADAALAQELHHIQGLVLANVTVELTPHQLGALTSLVYNAGTRVITDSTLSRKLNAGDYQGAAQEFPRWNKANQGGLLVAMPGLTKRRVAEQNLFLTPYTPISSK